MEAIKEAAYVAMIPAVRTTAQSLSGALTGVTLIALSVPDLKNLGTLVVCTFVGAIIAGVAAFCQNFAENV